MKNEYIRGLKLNFHSYFPIFGYCYVYLITNVHLNASFCPIFHNAHWTVENNGLYLKYKQKKTSSTFVARKRTHCQCTTFSFALSSDKVCYLFSAVNFVNHKFRSIKFSVCLLKWETVNVFEFDSFVWNIVTKELPTKKRSNGAFFLFLKC